MSKAKTIWAFADVDDMLITTCRESPVQGSQVAALDNKGVVCGWLTPKQKQFLGLLEGRVETVLTTARTSKGVSQLQLPIKGWAIASFGGVIRMPDGTSEARFHELMAAGAAQAAPTLKSLLAQIQEYCSKNNVDARLRIADDDGLDLFLSIKHGKRNLAEMAVLKDVLSGLLPEGWHLHFNGNFLAALPPFLGKDKAVTWFIQNLVGEGELTIGLGDSSTDLPFMGLCDLAVTPTGSQIFSTLTAGGSL